MSVNTGEFVLNDDVWDDNGGAAIDAADTLRIPINSIRRYAQDRDNERSIISGFILCKLCLLHHQTKEEQPPYNTHPSHFPNNIPKSFRSVLHKRLARRFPNFTNKLRSQHGASLAYKVGSFTGASLLPGIFSAIDINNLLFHRHRPQQLLHPLSPRGSLLQIRRQRPWASVDRSSQRPPPTNTDVIPADNIFVPIQADNILPQIPIGQHHSVPRKGIEDDEYRTLHTNKFYANAFLGEQNQPIWTHPYSLWWGKGGREPGYFATWGMNVGHAELEDLAYGEGNPARNFLNPKKQSIIVSARELDGETILTTDTHLPFSVNINLKKGNGENAPKMTFPVVQGMGFVTAGYQNACPMIQTAGLGFKEISSPLTIGKSVKYRIKDMDGRNWVMYVNLAAGTVYDAAMLTMVDNHTFILPDGFRGTIQIAKNPLGAEGEAIYDEAFGTFVVEGTLTGTVNDTRGSYSFNYTRIGPSRPLVFILPHHVQSLDPELKPALMRLQLRTTTKGPTTAIFADRLTFIEPNLPVTMSFGPWIPNTPTTRIRYPPDVLAFLAAVAERDLRRAMTEEILQGSLYYAGKALAKFATILWVTKDVLANAGLTATGLEKLKAEMARYVENRQRYPLYYDDSWKGIVSSAGFTNGPGADFGNTYYNDHHFHFGYFVYTWLDQGDNRAWTNTLVKDFAESEAFDYWHGHSWAKGLFESADGKDQESSGEDGFASFAVKMWGKVIGDVNMEKRGNLMLAIQARTFPAYFYLSSINTNQPPRFINNKVTGILFENKIDYATYFGTTPALIHGIHMLPLSPASTYLRPRAWVREEWDTHFNNAKVLRAVEGGWRGILYANLAIIDPKASYAFFRDGVDGLWDERWIDGGASRTWYLVWSAALGGGR
ncbi:glycoside hydrolase family 81 protein [Lentithecium fluviatile CBS 122367]|uniref:glucan endo-1,3-beta-D-glucosidase n=1 Tax=Lentithecium fluviatile CBS 122367 TaxID=1168545 RepID=A0A6G1JIF5_9PLEO|nr:glycoside hydrolase family 81 protein [Lentithecium fluviatile CBS 122367]